MILSLPFTYQAELLPGARGESRRVDVRDDVDVDVTEISRAEAIPGLEIAEPGSGSGVETILMMPGSRLASAVRSAKDGHPMSVREFRDALASTTVGSDSCLHRDILPFVPGGKSSPRPNRLDRLPSADELARCSRRTRIGRTVDFEARRDEAESRYARSFLIVDGIVYAECAEPAWQVTHRYGEPFGLILQRRPDVFWAADVFRLDRLEHAMSWARQWHVNFEARKSTVHVLSKEAMRRDDVSELVACAKSPLARVWFDAFEPYVEDDGRRPLAARVEAFLNLDRRLTEAESHAYLDALVGAYRGYMRLSRHGIRGNALGFAWIAERWVMEREWWNARVSAGHPQMAA